MAGRCLENCRRAATLLCDMFVTHNTRGEELLAWLFRVSREKIASMDRGDSDTQATARAGVLRLLEVARAYLERFGGGMADSHLGRTCFSEDMSSALFSSSAVPAFGRKSKASVSVVQVNVCVAGVGDISTEVPPPIPDFDMLLSLLAVRDPNIQREAWLLLMRAPTAPAVAAMLMSPGSVSWEQQLTAASERPQLRCMYVGLGLAVKRDATSERDTAWLKTFEAASRDVIGCLLRRPEDDALFLRNPPMWRLALHAILLNFVRHNPGVFGLKDEPNLRVSATYAIARPGCAFPPSIHVARAALIWRTVELLAAVHPADGKFKSTVAMDSIIVLTAMVLPDHAVVEWVAGSKEIQALLTPYLNGHCDVTVRKVVMGVFAKLAKTTPRANASIATFLATVVADLHPDNANCGVLITSVVDLAQSADKRSPWDRTVYWLTVLGEVLVRWKRMSGAGIVSAFGQPLRCGSVVHAGVVTVLSGMAALLKAVHRMGSEAGAAPTSVLNKLVALVLHTCLFASHDDVRMICVAAVEREAAYAFLDELSLVLRPAERYGVSAAVGRSVEDVLLHARTLPKEWNYVPKNDRRNEAGYVGLRNLGSTCYINAFLQQLFMIPKFRTGILEARPMLPAEVASQALEGIAKGPQSLSATDFVARRVGSVSGKAGVDDVRSAKDADDAIIDARLLLDLQIVFMGLQHGEMRYCDPSRFVLTSVGLELNSPVLQQNDAAEFCDKFIARLERRLKGGPQGSLLPSLFGGKLVTETLRSCCDNRAEQAEDFIHLALGITGCSSITQSLRAYVEGEVCCNALGHTQRFHACAARAQQMIGDNAVFCETCRQKSATRRRQCILTLPQVLILHLKRFEMDYQSMATKKVNERCAFPVRLNMWPFTKAGLETAGGATAARFGDPRARCESGGSDADARVLSEREADEDATAISDADYMLKGVLVHKGKCCGAGGGLC